MDYITKDEYIKQYPFELDEFQKKAITHIHRDESVLVSAHTSAGKTVCAEYAIAKAFLNNQRVIYTCPIKALSNEKYNDFNKNKFPGKVGLMTGDTTISPNAECLVMTTEILRSMLYNGSEILREVKWVIFDEVHYLCDSERGVVWEETIILLPEQVRFVFLSATVPNSEEFADWVSYVHKHPCYVCYTDYRPVPLEFFLFPEGSEEITKVYTQKEGFMEDQFQKALARLQFRNEDTERMVKQKYGIQNTDLVRLAEMLHEKDWLPVLIFCFSKRECKLNLESFKNLNFNRIEEAGAVQAVFEAAQNTLEEDDKALPQLEQMLYFLKRGIAMHHSGLLPVVKELVELLFSEGLVKCLFATETFAMGLNMPARTVVFSSLRKFDGVAFRYLQSGEFIQCAGRAGRRGQDERGNVILSVSSKMEPSDAKGIMLGKANTLISSFRLMFNQILTNLRIADVDISTENLIQKSFLAFQNLSREELLTEKIQEVENMINALDVYFNENEKNTLVKDIRLYVMFQRYSNLLKDQLLAEFIKVNNLSKYLTVGKIVCLSKKKFHFPGQYSDPCSIDFTIDSLYCPEKKWILPHSKQQKVTMIEELLKRNVESKEEMESNVELWKKSIPSFFDQETSNQDLFWGYVSRVRRVSKGSKDKDDALAIGGMFFVEIDVPCQFSNEPLTHAQRKNPNLMITVTLDANTINCISSLPACTSMHNVGSKNKITTDILNSFVFKQVIQKNDKVRPFYWNGISCLHPIDNLHFESEIFENISNNFLTLQGEICNKQKRILESDDVSTKIFVLKQIEMEKHFKLLTKLIKENRSKQLEIELTQRMKILKRLEYVDVLNNISLKGSVAARISTADELIVTELLFSGVLNNLEINEIVALLGCLVYQERVKDTVTLPQSLVEPFEELENIAKRVITEYHECGLEMDVDSILKDINQAANIIPVLMLWADGKTFAEAMDEGCRGMFEGSVIRCIRRLEELLRQLCDASIVLGATDMLRKFSAARDSIRRGIPFAPSLYVGSKK
eukprot:TRINITY_DN1258_c0_g1_i1.p1 TRINITY_DN1258_c0_g1~~TRINITY_DN1258_c0_g1_i1.p1  ORF type:complete len:1022 (-),score=298.05 TRINITY_DN1258_c0_g1_i1:83-3148(-)